jgi:hypothetical protein
MNHHFRIQLSDQAALIARAIESSPRELFVREMVQNAIDAEATECTFGIVERDGGDRLYIENNGEGMNESQLTAFATNWAHSQNRTDLNHGVGARLTGLAVSPAGVIVESCAAGIVRRVTLARIAPNLYGSVHEVEDVSREFSRAKRSSSWTRTILLGKSAEDPLDDVLRVVGGRARSNRARVGGIMRRIAMRYFRFRDGFEVRVDGRMTVNRAHANQSRFERSTTMLELMRFRGSSASGSCKYESVPVPGGTVHFAILPPPQAGNPRRFHVQGVEIHSGIGGIVARDEVIELVADKNNWRGVAMAAGFGEIALDVMMFVELDESSLASVRITEARDGLRWVDGPFNGERVSLKHFTRTIRDCRPAMIVDAVARAQRSVESVDAAVRERLAAMIRELNMRAVMPVFDDAGNVTTGARRDSIPAVEHEGNRAASRARPSGPGNDHPASPRSSLPVPVIALHFEGDPAIANLFAGSRVPAMLECADRESFTGLVLHVNATHELVEAMATRVVVALSNTATGWSSAEIEQARANDDAVQTAIREAMRDTFAFAVGAELVMMLYAAAYAPNSDAFRVSLIDSPELLASTIASASWRSVKPIAKAVRRSLLDSANLYADDDDE